MAHFRSGGRVVGDSGDVSMSILRYWAEINREGANTLIRRAVRLCFTDCP